MKSLLFSLLVLLAINLRGQCSFSITTSFTPASCSSCCDGAIAVTSFSGSASSCAPTTWSLSPTGVMSATANWVNLCAGNYTVNYVTACCTAAFICTLPFTTRIEGHERDEISIAIFPNPASDIIRLDQLLDEDRVLQIQILDILGKQVYCGIEKEIDVSSFVAGAYKIIIQKSRGGMISKNLIIAK